MKIKKSSFLELFYDHSIQIFTILVSVLPILWVIMSSFKTNKSILNNPFSLPDVFGFSQYLDVFTKYNFTQYFVNSFTVAIVATLISLIIYAMAGYVFAKYSFRGKEFLYILLTLTLLVPGHAKIQPIFKLVLTLNLYDSLTGLIVVYTSFGMALALFILRATFKTIPKSLDEAAMIDGASFFAVFWKINMPLAKSGLATAGVLLFLGNWNEYFYALLLTSSSSKRTLPVALGSFTEAFSYNYTQMFAALIIVIVPGIVLYLLTQEQVQKSVASSGVKG